MRRLRSILIAALALLCGCAGRQGLKRFECTEIIMAVPARIVLYAPDEAAAAAAARAAFDRMIALEAVMSDYRADSELSLLCDRAGGPPVAVSEDLFAVLDRSLVISEASGGAFDITVGPLVRLWRDARRRGAPPDGPAITEARQLVGWDKVRLDRAAGTAQLRLSGMRLDLGGIGKGFAADEAVGVLAEHGVTRCLVDLGGDITLANPPPGAARWSVRIESGLGDPEPRTLALARCAVATSGDAEQHFEHGGVRYSHLIDPRSGMALTQRRAVVVIAPDGATADAIASALSVMGAQGLWLVDTLPGCAALIEEQSRDGITTARSSRFE